MTRSDFMSLALTRYDVDQDGYVWRTTVPLGRYPRSAMVAQHKRNGYPTVSLCVDRFKRTVPVHRLVMHKFVGPSDLPVDHINGIRDDNRLENLEYVTSVENQRRMRQRVYGS